jgi:hypothetical protein
MSEYDDEDGLTFSEFGDDSESNTSHLVDSDPNYAYGFDDLATEDGYFPGEEEEDAVSWCCGPCITVFHLLQHRYFPEANKVSQSHDLMRPHASTLA